MDIKFSFLEDTQALAGAKEDDVMDFSQFQPLEKLEEPIAKHSDGLVICFYYV